MLHLSEITYSVRFIYFSVRCDLVLLILTMTPPSCPVCTQVIRYDDVRCQRCTTAYHTVCAVGFQGDSAAASWTCAACLPSDGGAAVDSIQRGHSAGPQPLNTDHFQVLMRELVAMRTSIENTNRLVEMHSRELADVKVGIRDLEAENSLLKERIRILEDRSQSCASLDIPFSEIRDRIDRQRNLMVRGVQDDESIDALGIVSEIMSSVLPNHVARIESAVRIGKVCPGKPRLIKVAFSDVSSKYAVLGRKVNLDRRRFPNIEIFNDLTPTQRRHLRQLKDELRGRRRNGESNLYIKYRGDEPFIFTGTVASDQENANKRQREDSSSPAGQPSKQQRSIPADRRSSSS